MEILLFIFTFIFIQCSSVFKLPFYRNNPKLTNINPEDFPVYYFETNYYTNITIGSNNQMLPMQLSFKYFHTFATIYNYTGGDYIKFNPDESSTYTKTYGQRAFFDINIKSGINSIESFKLKEINGGLISCNNIEFILGTIPLKNISGELGLKLSTKDESFNRLLNFGFINNLYKNKHIEFMVFSIGFFNENQGEIIIGHKINNTDEKSYVPVNDEGYSWGFQNFVSYLNGKRINIKSEYAEFQIESNIINPVINYVEKINRSFFEPLLNESKCIFINNNDYFHFYHCDKDINIENFPILTLYQQNLNYTFELTSNDLFEDIGDRKYFLVNFANNNDKKWILGKPFLKKYNFTYNFDSKTVSLFYGLKNEDSGNPDTPFNKLWIYIIIALVIIAILIGVIIIIAKKIPRKKRVNELEENFDYKEKKEDNNNEINNKENENQNKNSLGIDE